MNSEIVYLFLYDAGTRLTEEKLGGLMKNPEDFSKYEFTKPAPEEIATLDIPSIYNLKDETLNLDNVQHKFRVQVALYPFGGFSIRVRYPVTDGSNALLSKMTFDPKVNDFLKSLVERTKRKVETALKSKITAITINQQNETYRFYYVEGDKAQILTKSKKLIAGLLVDEKDAETLEADYIDYILNKSSLSYDSSNVLFVGWESAFMIDKEYAHEQELLMAEIANLQLLEMRIYHAVLADKLDMASRALSEKRKGADMKDLNKSLGSIYDNTRALLNNINDTVFGLGEWYLSRLYSLFSSVFKLDTWKNSIEKDLDAIDNERKFVSDIEVSRHEEFLERIVIVLIVIEIVVEVFYLIK